MAAPTTTSKISSYITVIQENIHTGVADPISLDSIEMDDSSHPKKIITFNNGFHKTGAECEDYPLSVFNTESFIPYYHSFKNKPSEYWRNPVNRNRFNRNDLKRIEHYMEALEAFPEEKISDINTVSIMDSITSRDSSLPSLDSEYEKNKGYLKYFLDFESIIDYYKSKGIYYDTREKATEYLIDSSSLRWVIRKCSIHDTEQRRHFVIQNNKGLLCAFQHRQGYGIVSVFGNRNSYVNELSYNIDLYYPTIGELLLSFERLGHISLYLEE